MESSKGIEMGMRIVNVAGCLEFSFFWKSTFPQVRKYVFSSSSDKSLNIII